MSYRHSFLVVFFMNFADVNFFFFWCFKVYKYFYLVNFALFHEGK